jgi:hypothetical protein
MFICERSRARDVQIIHGGFDPRFQGRQKCKRKATAVPCGALLPASSKSPRAAAPNRAFEEEEGGFQKTGSLSRRYRWF